MKKFAYLHGLNFGIMTTCKLDLKQIRGLVYYGLDHGYTITQVYQLCNPGDNNENIQSIASHWKRGKRVQQIFNEVEMEIDSRKKRMAEELNHDTKDNLSSLVDFTDKGQFIQYLNDAANRITDDKMKNDILKMLADHLDFKDESKRDESNQIQRFYLPLRCQGCKLYQDAAKSVTLLL